jgi:MFS family permease
MKRPGKPGWVAGTPLLVVLAMAQFMVVLDFTIVNVALPSIQAGLHIETSTLQWLISGYAVAFGGFLLLGGRLACGYRPAGVRPACQPGRGGPRSGRGLEPGSGHQAGR